MNQSLVQAEIVNKLDNNPYKAMKTDEELLDVLKEQGLLESYDWTPLLKQTRVGWGREEGMTKQYEAILTEHGQNSINEIPLREAILRGIKLRRAKT
jgi:hypothetical protein